MEATQPPGAAGLISTVHGAMGHLATTVAGLFRPRLSLGVRLMALDDDGRVFLVRHSYLPGLHMPGGAVDPAESCREAAEREAREEGGLTLPVRPELFHVYWNPMGNRRDHVVLFVGRGARQPVPWRPTLEIVAAGFHRLADLPADVTPETRIRLGEVLDGDPRSDTW